MPWPRLHPTFEERSVVDRQVHGEADGRRGKSPQEQPALPVVERAGRPEDEDDKEERPERSLNHRLPVERIHIKHQAEAVPCRAKTGILAGESRPRLAVLRRMQAWRVPMSLLRLVLLLTLVVLIHAATAAAQVEQGGITGKVLDKLNANSWTNTRNHVARGKEDFKQSGFTLGGPIRKENASLSDVNFGRIITGGGERRLQLGA